jgi:hypothetical protein
VSVYKKVIADLLEEIVDDNNHGSSKIVATYNINPGSLVYMALKCPSDSTDLGVAVAIGCIGF